MRMFKNLKLGIGMLKYGFRNKAIFVMGIVFFCLGVLFMILFSDIGYFAGATYFMITGVFSESALVSQGVTGMVQSSPKKKALHTSVPVILNTCWFYISYFIFMFIRLVMLWVRGQEMQPGEPVIYGLMAIICMVYGLGFYKLFYVAFGFFVLTFFPLCSGGEELICQALAGVPLWVAVLIGLAEILIGACIQYGLYRLTYRLPIDKMSVNMSLRKLM